MQTHHCTVTCRKKKGVTCRFNAPLILSMEIRTVDCEENIDELKVKSSKKLIEKELSYTVKKHDLSYVTPGSFLTVYCIQ